MTRIVSWLTHAARRLWLIFVVAAGVIILDQWTKELVRQTIAKYNYIVPIPALGEYVVLEHVDNYGAAFGILQRQGGLFVIIAAVVTLAIVYYAVRHLPEDQWFVRLLLGMQMGGALGNVVDRLTQGYVTDFVKIGIPGVYYWPNFNVADSAIVGGVIALAAVILWQDTQRSRRGRAGRLGGSAPPGPANSSEA